MVGEARYGTSVAELIVSPVIVVLVRILFVSVAELEKGRIVESLTDEHQADRRTVGVSTRDGESGMVGEIE